MRCGIFLLIVFLAVVMSGVVSAIPQIEFVDPTPNDCISTLDTSFEINISITESSLGNVTYKWNGTNFTFFDDSVFLWMNFNNVSVLGEKDTLVYDVSGNGNNGTVTGTAGFYAESGKYGGAFYFDGSAATSTNHIEISDVSGFDVERITVLAWVNASFNTAGGYEGIVTRDAGGGANRIWGLYARKSTNAIYFQMFNESDSVSTCDGSSTLISGQWIHVALTFNGSDSVGYVNGEEDCNIPLEGGVLNTGLQHIQIGRRGSDGAGTYPLNGSVDEVIIFNRTLSDEEIRQFYFMNLYKYDINKWSLYVNQSKNSTTGLEVGDYTYQVFVTNSSNDLNSTSERTITISENYIPLPSSFSLVSVDETNLSSSALNCSTQLIDNNNHNINVSLKWYKNNVLFLEQNYNNSYSNGTSFSTLLNSGNYSGGETIYCSLRLYDGLIYSNWNSSDSLIILDTSAPLLDFITPSSLANSLEQGENLIINVSLTENNLKSLIWNFDGENYTLFSDDLIAMYNFDNLSALGENDASVVDITGNHDKAVVVGALFNSTGGKYGGAYEFDGDGDYIDLGDFHFNDSFSIVFWFKTPSNATYLNNIFIADRTANTDYNRSGVTLTFNRGFDFIVANKTSNFAEYQETSISLEEYNHGWNNNQWHHAVATYNRSSGKARVYVDKQMVSYSNYSFSTGSLNGEHNLTIGGYWHILDPRGTLIGDLNGSIDELMIWNKSLSKKEIEQLYNLNLYKSDADKWNLYLNYNNPNVNNSFYLYSSDSGNRINQSSAVSSISQYKICEYYDCRKATVIWTGDDWDGTFHSGFINASDAAQEYNIVFSSGVVTGNNNLDIYDPDHVTLNSTQWGEMQTKVDTGYLSPVSHSHNHEVGADLPYDNNDLEIGGSQSSIINNLTMPFQNRYNGSEFMVGWIEPGGATDTFIRQNLSAYNYLISRAVITTKSFAEHHSDFALWNPDMGYYSRYGPTSIETSSIENLNSEFDSVYSQEGIHHIYSHPYSYDWANDSNKLEQHISYIGNRTDVWYVGWGQLYLYRYLYERAKPTINITTSNSEEILVKINASTSERQIYGLSYPLTYAFSYPSTWDNVLVEYSNESISSDLSTIQLKESSQWFNGINAYRVNATENIVYISHGLPEFNNEMYFKIYTSQVTPTTTTPTTTSPDGSSPTYQPTKSNLEKGYSKILQKNWKIEFEFENKTHIFNVDDVKNDSVVISVESDKQTFELKINETKKLNLNNYSYYDLEIFLNGIDYRGADLTLKSIYEEIPAEELKDKIKENVKNNLLWLWIVLGLIIIGVFVGIGFGKKKRK